MEAQQYLVHICPFSHHSLEAPTALCDPSCHLRPSCASSCQRSALQLQHPSATPWLPHTGGTHQQQRSAAAGGGGRPGGGGRGGHGERWHGADGRGQQRHWEQEAELRRAGRDMQQWTGQRRASCCQSRVWSGTHDLLRPNRGIVGYWEGERTDSVCVHVFVCMWARVSRGSCSVMWLRADYAMVLNGPSGWSCMSV